MWPPSTIAIVARVACGCSLSSTLLLADAALEWSTKDMHFELEPRDRQVETKFDFRNVGNEAVAITKVVTSCGCTTAQLAKTRYAPGESGSIKAIFVVGDRVGEYTATIDLYVDGGTAPADTLKMHFKIPEVVRLTPRTLTWKRGGEPTPQKVLVWAVGKSPVRVLGIGSDDRRLTVSLETMKESRAYEITVVPTDTMQQFSGRAKITLLVGNDQESIGAPESLGFVRLQRKGVRIFSVRAIVR